MLLFLIQVHWIAKLPKIKTVCIAHVEV